MITLAPIGARSKFSSLEVKNNDYVSEAFHQLVRERRSVRGFRPDLIPEETLQSIFETARWAPSGTNIQPWRIYVASGEACDRLRVEFLKRFDAGEKANTDHPGDGKVAGVWRDRKRACAKVLYDAMSIEWEDRPGRAAAAAGF